VDDLRLPTLADLHAARERVARIAARTPLVRLPVPGRDIRLKLENLQPIGSFKLRGAGNAIARRPVAVLAGGVCTASAGNMAQGVAWCARSRGIACRVIVPESAPSAKTVAVERLGATIVRLAYEDWWRVIETHDAGDVPGAFVHPVADNDVMAGNGTIGLELAEEAPDARTVVIPYGGGGLLCGIAAALAAVTPGARVLAAEVETAAPLRASLAAGRPVRIARQPSFVDGIGGGSLLDEMWPLVRQAVAGSVVVTLDEVASAIRLLAGLAHVVAEGAGGAALAAALRGDASMDPVVCVISGGNIDAGILARILEGETPA
jgi:threonine dehydratase